MIQFSQAFQISPNFQPRLAKNVIEDLRISPVSGSMSVASGKMAAKQRCRVDLYTNISINQNCSVNNTIWRQIQKRMHENEAISVLRRHFKAY